MTTRHRFAWWWGMAVLVTASPAAAQIVRHPPFNTIANLGTCTDGEPRIKGVTDGASATDCATGGGSTDVICECKDGTWAAIAGGGGSGDITDVGDCATGACFQSETAGTFFAAPGGGGVAAFRTILDSDVPDTITVDLAATATALAANGGNCGPGQWAAGVDASGAAEGCTADDTGTDDQTAPEVPVTDAGGFFSGADVEAALQEIGPTMTDSRTPTAHDLAGALHTASGLTAGWTIRATGATTFAWAAIQDGDLPASIARDSEVPSLETDPAACGNAACAVGTDDTVTLAQGTTPTPTVEGRIEWDTDDDRIVVGDGAGQVTFFGGAHTVDTGPSPDCSGTSTYQDGEGGCDAVGGDLSGGLDAAQVADDSHDHSAAGSTVTINSADIVDINAGTDPTADLEEEAHATEHQHGGADEVATASPAANAIPKAGAGGDLDAGWLPASTTTTQGAVVLSTDGEATASEAVQGTDGRLPTGFTWSVTAATCTGDGNAGALTVNGSNQIVCSADDGGGGGSGDAVEVEDGDNLGTFTAIDTTARLDDAGDVNFVFADGGAGGPDVVTGFVKGIDADADGTREVTANGAIVAFDLDDDGSPNLDVSIQSAGNVQFNVEGGSGPLRIGSNAGLSAVYTSSGNNGPAMAQETVSATNPTLLPRSSDNDTGIGSAAANDLRVIAGGVSGLGQTDTATTLYVAQANDPKAQTCTDSGDGSPGALTMTVSGLTYKAITNADADGCAVTISETGAKDGQRLEVVIVSNAGGTVDFADTPGVTEIATAFSASEWDAITFRYAVDRWVEVSRSNN